MVKYSTWTALRNPVFRQLWIASVISGTCVAAHDGAATWMMNKLTGSPFLISLMSTVALLSFFLFTLPAGVLADKVDRQKLVCTINLCLAAKALGLAVLGWLHLLILTSSSRFEGLSRSCFMHKLLKIRQFHQNTKLER